MSVLAAMEARVSTIHSDYVSVDASAKIAKTRNSDQAVAIARTISEKGMLPLRCTVPRVAM